MLFWVLYSLGLLFLRIGSVNAGQSGQATYFAVGLCVVLAAVSNLYQLTKFSRGACGWINGPTDFVSRFATQSNIDVLNIA
jgi:hypothetical protein